MKTSYFIQFLLLLCILVLPLNSPHADGFIVIPRPHTIPAIQSNPFPLEVKYHHVEVSLKDRIATTSIDQVFVNPTALMAGKQRRNFSMLKRHASFTKIL